VERVDEHTSSCTTRISQLVVNDEDLAQCCHGEDTGEPNEQHEGDCLAGFVWLDISWRIACNAMQQLLSMG